MIKLADMTPTMRMVGPLNTKTYNKLVTSLKLKLRIFISLSDKKQREKVIICRL